MYLFIIYYLKAPVELNLALSLIYPGQLRTTWQNYMKAWRCWTSNMLLQSAKNSTCCSNTKQIMIIIDSNKTR